MLLDAGRINGNRPDEQDLPQEGTLRWTFRIASAPEMEHLGAAFARAVLPLEDDQDAPPLRIGLAASPGTGKSTFSKGLLNTIEEKEAIESACSMREQNTWRTPKGWLLRHYDTWVGCDTLPSYRNDDTAQYGPAVTDLVEHPYDDKINKKFNILVFFKKEDYWQTDSPRQVTLVAPEEAINKVGFQRFLNECSHLTLQANMPAPETPQQAARPGNAFQI